MDIVIFTEGMPLEEFQRDRPREYRKILAKARLHRADHRVDDDCTDCLRDDIHLPLVWERPTGAG